MSRFCKTIALRCNQHVLITTKVNKTKMSITVCDTHFRFIHFGYSL